MDENYLFGWAYSKYCQTCDKSKIHVEKEVYGVRGSPDDVTCECKYQGGLNYRMGCEFPSQDSMDGNVLMDHCPYFWWDGYEHRL